MEIDYLISIDRARGLMLISLSGFFDHQSVERLDNERREALDRLGCGPNGHLTLCDVSGCRLQAQEIVAAFAQVIADPTTASRRMAFVTGSSLARMQVRRLMTRPDMACFETRAMAEAWLFEESSLRTNAA